MTPRRAAQAAALVLAAVLVAHGVFGPDFAPRNLATLFVWVHLRGLLVLVLLAFGNAFCMACPFTLVRDGARRLTRPVRRWPRALRTKLPAVVLFAAVLYSYERFGLWSSPTLTAALILAYFALALLVDAGFSGAPFCKWVCPLGQFNFVASALSPLEVVARDLGVCAACRTKDCLRGRRAETGEVLARGCELGLFVPRKAGNMDCTFCLDCMAACPAGNVALARRLPGAELFDDRWRSGVGRPSRRTDLAVLCAVFLFGGLVNAYAMTGPAGGLGTLFVVGLAAVPALLFGAAAGLSRRAVGEGWLGTARRFAPATVPLGAGVWGAHYGFHLLTGAGTLVPAVQAAVEAAAGVPALGRPAWGLGGLSPASAQGIGQGLLLLGLTGSLVAARRLGEEAAPEHPGAASWPWMALLVLVWAAGAWVLSRPMAMRGVSFG